MKNITKIAIISLLSVAVSAQITLAQQQDTPLQQALERFDNGEWEASILDLEQILDSAKLDVEKRTQARKYIALGHVLLGHKNQAVEVYKEIVRDNPEFDMDALSVAGEAPPPDAERLFAQAVLKVRKEELEARAARLSATSNSGAIVRSLALPGWGQRYQGYRGRGYMMLGLTGASIVYAVLSKSTYSDSKDAYNGAQVGDDFSALYDNFSRKADRADLALGLVGAVWVLNIFDAVVQGPNIANLQADFKPADSDRGTGLALVVSRNF